LCPAFPVSAGSLDRYLVPSTTTKAMRHATKATKSAKKWDRRSMAASVTVRP